MVALLFTADVTLKSGFFTCTNCTHTQKTASLINCDLFLIFVTNPLSKLMGRLKKRCMRQTRRNKGYKKARGGWGRDRHKEWTKTWIVIHKKSQRLCGINHEEDKKNAGMLTQGEDWSSHEGKKDRWGQVTRKEGNMRHEYQNKVGNAKKMNRDNNTVYNINNKLSCTKKG